MLPILSHIRDCAFRAIRTCAARYLASSYGLLFPVASFLLAQQRFTTNQTGEQQ